MKVLWPALFAAWFLAAHPSKSEAVVLVADDPGGAAARVAAPVCVDVDLAALFGKTVDPGRLRLVELVGAGGTKGADIPLQFVARSGSTSKGRLWWLMPPGAKGERRFRLSLAGRAAVPALAVGLDKERKAVDVREGELPVLRYNQGTVAPPPQIVEKFEKRRKPPLYYARGDYIHPIFGPDGQALTDDYSLDHPHHRGLCWAWPVVRHKGEVRDLWAVRVLPTQPGGVWARPVSLDRVEAGPVLAAIDAENVWKWGDKEPIVREQVAIRAFRQKDRCRFLDVELRLIALVDDVRIGGRPGASYGGFTLRTFPQFQGRKIDMHVEPQDAKPRRAWFHLTGSFPGGKGPAGVVLLEHVANPDYPSYPRLKTDNPDRVPDAYPRWRSVQPAWPGDREVPLEKGKPLVLNYRLWIHPGLSDEATLGAVWASYAKPPKVRVEP